uniref:hypothetical protein n=2 Tax=Pseudomonas viridiflava TaxID=33069 RepID=UPI00197EC593
DVALRKTHRRQAASHCSPWLQQAMDITLSASMGMIGERDITLIVPTLQRGKAAQDAPRPLSGMTQLHVLHAHP